MSDYTFVQVLKLVFGTFDAFSLHKLSQDFRLHELFNVDILFGFAEPFQFTFLAYGSDGVVGLARLVSFPFLQVLVYCNIRCLTRLSSNWHF